MPRDTNSEPIATYEVGTPIPDVRHFDRSIKVAFQCKTHRGATWVSKDPRVSSWFILEDGADCACKSSNMVVVRRYQPTRNG